jgi:chromosome segregation ATPase
MPAVSLPDLQQQIAARERELQVLRQELASRQDHLTELTRHKEELQRQLQQVEEEITALAAASPTVRAQPEAVAPAAPASVASRAGLPRLGELIVSLLREAAGARTARQLCEEAQRRGYQPRGKKPIKSVESRLQDLKSQGVVRRASGQPGYILTPAAHRASQDNGKPSHRAAAFRRWSWTRRATPP